MTTTYFKAVRPNGRDFYSNTVQWAPEAPEFDSGGEKVVLHPTSHDPFSDRHVAAGYLSVSVVPTDCTGHEWPCRLLEVEAVEGHEVFTPDAERLPSKRAATAFRVLRELPAHLVFGPQGEQIAALIERARTLTADELERLASAWGAAWGAARGAARDAARGAAWGAAWGAARDAARGAAWGAAWGAVLALLVRDLVSTEYYDELSGPWRQTIGRIHPDDVDPMVAAA